MGISAAVGRYIGISAPEFPETDHHYCVPERHLLISLNSVPQHVYKIDLRPDQGNRPSAREIDLHEGDTKAALRSICRDITWCGHWEGRWLPVWPQPAPDWLK